MSQTILFLLDGASAILVLMLVSLGLAIIFGLMNVINMAHGEFLMLGAYGVLALTGAGVPFLAALLIAPFGVAVIGLLAEELVIRRTYQRLLDTILATWGLSLALRQAIILIYGPGSHAVQAPDVGSIMIFGSPYPVYRLIVMALAVAAILGVFLVFFKTRIGLMARAVIANRDMASALGVNTRMLDRFTFGAWLAGLAGAAMTPLISIDPQAGLGWLVPGFLAILVGGLGSIAAPMAGAVGVGGVDALTSTLASPIAAQIAVFLAAVLVIRFFPNGLLGRKRREA
jgi:urea transport system permease protein